MPWRASAAPAPASPEASTPPWRTRSARLPYRFALEHQQRIHARLEPVHAPVQVRARGATGRADRADDRALFDALAHARVDTRQVQEVGAHAVAMVQHQRAAGEVERGI